MVKDLSFFHETQLDIVEAVNIMKYTDDKIATLLKSSQSTHTSPSLRGYIVAQSRIASHETGNCPQQNCALGHQDDLRGRQNVLVCVQEIPRRRRLSLPEDSLKPST